MSGVAAAQGGGPDRPALLPAAACDYTTGYLAVGYQTLAHGPASLTCTDGSSVTAPVIAPFDPEEANASITLASPSASHWLGTDISGMDIFSRIIYSARIDLVIAVLGTCFSILIGGPLGLIAGYFSGARGLWGWISEIMMRVADVLQAFPVFVLAIALVAALGQSARNVILAIAFVNAPIYLRLLRTQALSRIYLDNFPSVQSSWVTQGLEIGQVALKYGANDLGSIMIEENVVSQAGTTFRMGVADMQRLIKDLGYEPHQRDNWYRLLN